MNHERWVSTEMAEIWSLKTRIDLARAIWLQVMRVQASVDGTITEGDLLAYAAVAPEIDLDAHRQAEQITGHEVAAWIRVFDDQAAKASSGQTHGKLHWGLTSCDITENITTWQIRDAMRLLRDRAVAVLSRLAILINSYATVPLVARTHGLPAQATTLGKRFAVCAQEILAAWTIYESTMRDIPTRGIQGAVGTSSDMLAIVDRSTVDRINWTVATTLGTEFTWLAIGQTPIRSADALAAACVAQLCAGPGSTATTIRLMVAAGLATERPTRTQVGSSAMPHKLNPRYAERVCGLQTVIRGYQSMLNEISGQTWNEGDVSDSAVRRVALPGLFSAADGLLRSFMVCLDRFAPSLAAIETEVQHYRTEMASGQILAAAVSQGADRSDAHMAISEAEGRLSQLANDSRIGLDLSVLRSLRESVRTGRAPEQAMAVLHGVEAVIAQHYEASGYDPGVML